MHLKEGSLCWSSSRHASLILGGPALPTRPSPVWDALPTPSEAGTVQPPCPTSPGGTRRQAAGTHGEAAKGARLFYRHPFSPASTLRIERSCVRSSWFPHFKAAPCTLIYKGPVS